MCRLLFESVRVQDGVPCLLDYHQARVNRSLAAGRMFDLRRVTEELDVSGPGVSKLRITYDEEGAFRGAVREPYAPRVVRSLRVVECPGAEYGRKWEDRSVLLAARAMAADADEVMIARGGWVTDSSFSNFVFGEPGCWVTPASFLLAGTKRAFLLDEGIITVRPVHVGDVGRYKYVSLINAMLDPGEVMLPVSAVRMG